MLSQFDIPKAKSIPFLDQEDNIIRSLKNGGKSRGLHPILYGLKRARNYLLFLFAYVAPSNFLRITLNKWKGVHFGKNVYLGMFVFIDNAYPEYIFFDDHSSINAGSMIISHFNLKKHFQDIITPSVEPVIIKEGAIISARSIILPGVVIGIKSIVSAGSVVNRSVPDYTLVSGNPAKKVTVLKINNA